MPITPALKRLRQEGHNFKASPDLSKFQANLSINELVSLKKKKKGSDQNHRNKGRNTSNKNIKVLHAISNILAN